MKKKLTKLTEAQKSRIPEWRDRWIKIGLSTEPADRPRFESAVLECYRAAGLENPKAIIWVPSPMVGAFAASASALIIELALARRHLGGKGIAVRSAVYSAVDSSVRSAVSSAVSSAVDSAVASAVYSSVSAVGSAVHSAVGSAVDSAVRSAVGSAVGSAVDSAVRSAVGSAVDSAVDSAVRSAVESSVHSAVRSAVGSAVGSAVDSAVRSAVGSAVVSAVGSAVHSAVDSAVDSAVRSAVESARSQRGLVRFWHYWMGGQLWPGWQSYTTFFSEVCGLDLGPDLNLRLKSYAATCDSAGYWWPNKDFVIVSERPRVISLDTNGRLHREDGPAFEARDGWGVYSWHGVTVPRDVVMAPESITHQQIDDEKNAEVRRVMLERYGAERYIIETNSKMVARDEVGELYRRELPGDEPLVMVKVLNSTPEPDGSIRTYWLRVPPDTQRPRQGIAWTFGLSEKEYCPVKET